MTLAIGDVVTLKGQTQKMTVLLRKEKDEKQFIYCIWIDATGQPHNARFEEATLTRVGELLQHTCRIVLENPGLQGQETCPACIRDKNMQQYKGEATNGSTD